jgi:hypothetical protein
MSVPLVTSGGKLIIWAYASYVSDGTIEGDFAIFIDGAPVTSGGIQIGVGGGCNVRGGVPDTVAIDLEVAALPAGAHTVTLRWKSPAGVAITIDPTSASANQGASLTVAESSV